MADGLAPGRRDQAFPQRRRAALHGGQSGRHGPRVRLLHEAGVRTAGALQPLRRTRRQPRLVHERAAGNHEREQGHVPRVVSADHVQPPSDRAGRRRDVRAAVPRSVQLQLPSVHSGGDGHHRRGDFDPRDRRGQAGCRQPQGVELLDVVERRLPHGRVFPQRAGDPDRDHRQSHADAGAVHDTLRDRRHEQLVPDAAAAGLAFPPVDRLLDHRESRDPRLRVALPRGTAVPHLPDGS